MISVIIPTFNRNAFLRQAVGSVLGQTFRDWELLVVDDGSETRSGGELDALGDHRIRYHYQGHRGVSAARNAGLRLARHPWVAFLDSDDYWHPAKLERQMEALNQPPRCRAVHTDEIWIRRGRRVNPKKIHRKYGGWIFRHCLPRCIVSPSSILLHRDLLDAEGVFDEALPACEDYDLWLRISCRHPIRFLEEPLIVKVGGHADQLSRKFWGLDRFRLQALLKIHGSGKLTPQQQTWTAREIQAKADILASGFANRGKTAEAEEYRRLSQTWGEGQGPHPGRLSEASLEAGRNSGREPSGPPPGRPAPQSEMERRRSGPGAATRRSGPPDTLPISILSPAK